MKEITNDGIYTDVMDPINDTANYFAGHIVKVDKLTSEEEEEIEKSDDEELKKRIKDNAGLEDIINSFNKTLKENNFDDIEGNEGLVSKFKTAAEYVIQFIKDIGRWIYNFFNNKITRMNNKILYVEQKRKVDGVKNKQVKYPKSIYAMMVPNKVSDNPIWVVENAELVIKLHHSINEARRAMKRFITISDTNVPDRVENVIESVYGAFNGKLVSTGLYQSYILPGNKYINFVKTNSTNKREKLIYLATSSTFVNLKNDTFQTSSHIVDETISKLKTIQNLIEKEQKDVSTLHRNFEQEVKKLISKHKDTSVENKNFLTWLVSYHKQLTSITLQYTFYTMDAMIDFAEANLNG